MVCTPFESCLQLRYAVLAHRVLRLVQVVDTLRKIPHANELQIRLAQFDSGSRLHPTPNKNNGLKNA